MGIRAILPLALIMVVAGQLAAGAITLDERLGVPPHGNCHRDQQRQSHFPFMVILCSVFLASLYTYHPPRHALRRPLQVTMKAVLRM